MEVVYSGADYRKRAHFEGGTAVLQVVPRADGYVAHLKGGVSARTEVSAGASLSGHFIETALICR